MNARLSHINDLLRHNAVVRDLLERRERELNLLARVRSGLPEAMRTHCLEASLAETRLTLYFDSAAWATRARFLAEDIETKLEETPLSEEWKITEIRIQVRPHCYALDPVPARISTPEDAPAPKLTRSAAQHLLEAAEHVHDPDLRQVLKRLANRRLQPAQTRSD